MSEKKVCVLVVAGSTSNHASATTHAFRPSPTPDVSATDGTTQPNHFGRFAVSLAFLFSKQQDVIFLGTKELVEVIERKKEDRGIINIESRIFGSLNELLALHKTLYNEEVIRPDILINAFGIRDSL